MSKYTVCRQEWRRFPKVLVVRNVETGEERRYVPESEDASTVSVERIEVNGHELTTFDLPPEPRNTYHVDVDGENDKLRELVRDMVMNMGGCALHGNPLRLREFMCRAKELGVSE